MLNEDPDTYHFQDKMHTDLKYRTRDGEDIAYGFGMNIDGEIETTKPGLAHDTMDMSRTDKPFAFYQGRVWVNHNIVSFWEYPPKSILLVILDYLENQFPDLDIPTMTIEIYLSHNLPGKGEWANKTINNYPIIRNPHDQTPERIEHILSPILKANKKVPDGVGSKKAGKPLDLKQAMYTESFYPKMNESPDVYKLADDNGYKREIYYSNSTGKDIAHAFGMNIDRKVKISAPGKIHGHLDNGITDGKLFEFYQGRIWPNHNVISFWIYPPKEILLLILDYLEKQFPNIDIPTMTIEVHTGFWNNRTIDNYPTFPSNDDNAPERLKHMLSPVLKKEKVPDGIGSKKPGKPLDLKQAMYTESFYPKMNESPDRIMGMHPTQHYFKSLVDWYADLTYAFGIYDNKMLVSTIRETHHDIIQKIKEDSKMSGFLSRGTFEFPGRIWLFHKYISFWTYPKNNADMKKFIKELEVSLEEQQNRRVVIWDDPEFMIDIKIDSDITDIHSWDTYNEKTVKQIPLQDYVGSDDASKEEMKTPHTLTPSEKEKLRKQTELKRKAKGEETKPMPKIGSGHPKRKPLNYKQAMYTESYYPRLN